MFGNITARYFFPSTHHIPITNHNPPTLIADSSSSRIPHAVPIYTNRGLMLHNSQPQSNSWLSHTITTSKAKQDGKDNNFESKNKQELVSSKSDLLQGLGCTMKRLHPTPTEKAKEKDKTNLTINAKGVSLRCFNLLHRRHRKLLTYTNLHSLLHYLQIHVILLMPSLILFFPFFFFGSPWWCFKF